MRIEYEKELKVIIDKINDRFKSLSNFSNDDLRTQMSIIQTSITESENLEQTLDANLIDVFALVKEIARRLSEGDVIVSANKNDLDLAIEYDFVTIKDKQAIYKHKWSVCGQKEEWNMIHFDEQLMGGILLHRGYAVEMATGEGKTLVATLPVMLNALSHKGVHLMTVNDYLSKRDFELTRPLYMFFGLSVGCIELFSRHGQFRKEAYKADIVFGTNSQFTFDYLFDHLATRKEDCVQTNHHYAIIDELDSILIDEAETSHIVSGGDAIDVGEMYKKVKKLFEEFIATNDNSFYVVDKVNHIAYYTERGEEELENRLSMPGLFKTEKLDREIDEEEMPSPQEKEILEKLEMKNVLIQMLYAYELEEKDVDYIVKNGRIVIIDEHTGRPKPSHRWSYGLHTAVEVKEDLPPMNEHDGIATISLKNYLNLYDKKCGMSGTIMSVSQELLDVYNLHSANIPTHKAMIREDLSMRIFKTEKQKDKAIVDYVQELHKAGRPILVGCLNTKRSGHIAALIEELGLPFQLLDAKSLENEAAIIAQAGQHGAITISTSIAGRGTDIKLSSQAREAGGLAVVGTDLFDSNRVDNQLKGRAGRQGDPGTSRFFVSIEDQILKNLSLDEKMKLDNLVANYTKQEELSSDDIKHYVILAQELQEKRAFTARQKNTNKDDIIAPQRIKFYNERARLLTDENAATDFINQFAADKRALIEEHIDALYEQVKNLLIRISFGERLLMSIPLVFAEGNRLFTIVVDIQATIASRQFFAEEYKRQMVLHTFDRYWKRFVSHLLSKLDVNEVNKLPDDFNLMNEKIKEAVLRRLLFAEMPIRKISTIERAKRQEPNKKRWNPTPINFKRRTIILKSDNNQLCPCGSGKKFSECHGRDIRYNRLRNN